MENSISKISLLQTHYQSDSLVSKRLHTSIEQLQLEIGTDNPFTTCSYSKYGPLATNGWLKTLWLAISNLPIKIFFRRFITIQLQRDNDQLLIPAVINLEQYSSAQLIAFNRVQLYLHVMTIADIYTGEGTNIRVNMLSLSPTPILSSYRWPVTHPIKSDFRVWLDMMEHLAGRFSLGEWLTLGHSKPDCFYDTENNEVYIKQRNRWKQYSYPSSSRSLRLRSKYIYNKVVCQVPTTSRGTYSPLFNSTIFFEGAQGVSIPRQKSFNTLSYIFSSWGETWIWKHLSIENNGEWLAYALYHGTAILVCDRSFQSRLTTTKGTAAWVIKCTDTGNKAIGTALTPTEVANAYRSELLGLYAALAAVLAVTTLHKVTTGSLSVGCDNEKALYLSSLLNLKVPAKLQHSDILRSIMVVRNSLPLSISFKHISAHQDDTIMYSSLDSMSQLNVDCDLLAKSALDYYRQSKSLKPVKSWGPQLVLKLLGIVRTQWLYRCEVVNKRDKDGLLKQEASLLRISIRNEYQLGDTGLLDEDKYLFSYDLSSILEWHIDKRKMWVHAVKVARAISRGEIFTSPAPIKRHQLRRILPKVSTQETIKRKASVFTITYTPSKKPKRSTTPSSANKRKSIETAHISNKRQNHNYTKRKQRSQPNSFGVTKWKKRK